MSALHNFSDTGDLHTSRDWLRFAVSAFNEAKLSFGHGSTSAYDEAVYLILHTLHLPLDTLEPFLDARLTPHEKNALHTVLNQRVETRLPAAYLTHEAWLGDFRFYVDKRVIVPRSFIAELLREHLAPWIDESEAINYVLDLCTGSGCLAIIAAHAFPYVATLPEEYRHEPQLALGSGHDGLDATRIILQNAAQYLTENGVLIVEIGHNREALEEAYPDLPFTWLDVTAGDQFVFMLHRNDLL